MHDYFPITDIFCPPHHSENLLGDIQAHINSTGNTNLHFCFITLNELIKAHDVIQSIGNWQAYCQAQDWKFNWHWITNSCTGYCPNLEDHITRINWFEYLTYIVHTKHNQKFNKVWSPHKEVLFMPGKMNKQNRYATFEVLAKYSNIFQDTIYSFILNKQTEEVYQEIFDGNNLGANRFRFTGFKDLADIKKLEKNLDIELTLSQNDNTFHYTGWPYDVNLYKDTGWSIVCETTSQDYSLSDITNAWITEKTFRPIINHHPMLIVDDYEILIYLKKLGYETYDFLYLDHVQMLDSWNKLNHTSYTLEHNIHFKEQFAKCLNEFQQKILDTKYQNKIKEITEHNHNKLINNAKNIQLPKKMQIRYAGRFITLDQYLEQFAPYTNSISKTNKQVEIIAKNI